jgi:SpoVK/Ycf46/Vps4 family AAA+-type ATPase
MMFDELNSIEQKRWTVNGANTLMKQLLWMINGVDAFEDVLLTGITK